MQSHAPPDAEELEALYQQHSGNVDQVELEYTELGVVFYVFSEIEDMDFDDKVQKAFRAGTPGQQNTMLPAIDKIRVSRDEAKKLLRDGKLVEAADCLDKLEDAITVVADEIILLQWFVTTRSGMVEQPTKKNLVIFSDPAERSRLTRNSHFRVWALRLPEVRSRLTSGALQTLDEALDFVLEDRQ